MSNCYAAKCQKRPSRCPRLRAFPIILVTAFAAGRVANLLPRAHREPRRSPRKRIAGVCRSIFHRRAAHPADLLLGEPLAGIAEPASPRRRVLTGVRSFHLRVCVDSVVNTAAVVGKYYELG